MVASPAGIHYNVESIYYGIKGAPNKLLALKYLIPYFQIYFLIYLTSFSQFFDQAVLLFLCGLGMYQTYLTGILNIASTANIPFDYKFIDPIIYAGLLMLDIYRVIPSEYLAALYLLHAASVVIKYLMFITSVVQ